MKKRQKVILGLLKKANKPVSTSEIIDLTNYDRHEVSNTMESLRNEVDKHKESYHKVFYSIKSKKEDLHRFFYSITQVRRIIW